MSAHRIQLTYQEHAGVQAIRGGFTDQLIGGMELFHGPFVLFRKLLKTLGLAERSLQALYSAE
jgi:hypothetical protein